MCRAIAPQPDQDSKRSRTSSDQFPSNVSRHFANRHVWSGPTLLRNRNVKRWFGHSGHSSRLADPVYPVSNVFLQICKFWTVKLTMFEPRLSQPRNCRTPAHTFIPHHQRSGFEGALRQVISSWASQRCSDDVRGALASTLGRGGLRKLCNIESDGSPSPPRDSASERSLEWKPPPYATQIVLGDVCLTSRLWALHRSLSQMPEAKASATMQRRHVCNEMRYRGNHPRPTVLLTTESIRTSFMPGASWPKGPKGSEQPD